MLPATETLPNSTPIDVLSRHDACAALINGQRDAVSSVAPVTDRLMEAADVMAVALRAGCSLTYAAAGSSGLMALADCSELAGTFGISQNLIHILMAGGVPVDGCMPGDTEDNIAEIDVALSHVTGSNV